MARYSYTAIDSSGREKTGKIDATNESDARSKLSGQGLMVSSISADGSSVAKKGAKTAVKKVEGAAKTMKKEQLTLFTRQIATLLQSGLPLLKSLEVMIRQERNPRFRVTLETIADSVRSGNPFSEGLSQFPKLFEPLYINMIRAGEAGGVLDTVLGRLANFMEKDLKTQKKIQSAMVYPLVVISVAVVIVVGLMIGVVPQFQGIFNDMLKGAPLPALTQLVVNVANIIKPTSIEHGLIMVGCAFALIFGFQVFIKSPAGQTMLDWMALYLPKVGELGTKAAISRFTRTFGTLLSSGVPILQALNITRDVIGNRFMSSALNVVHDRVRDGESLAGPLGQQKIFPVLVTSMVEVGEETGDLASMLNRIADNYDEDVDNSVSSITSIIEPIMIVVLAIVVGVIVIALFLPIITIIKTLQG